MNLKNMDYLDNDFSVFHLCPELLSTVVLLIGIYQMYFHPVYSTLFFDLFVTLFSSLLNVLVFPFITEIKYRFVSLHAGQNRQGN